MPEPLEEMVLWLPTLEGCDKRKNYASPRGTYNYIFMRQASLVKFFIEMILYFKTYFFLLNR